MRNDGPRGGPARGGRAGARQGPNSAQRRAERAAAAPRPGKPVRPRPKPAAKAHPPAEAAAPRVPTRREVRAAASETLATGVQTLVVEPDEGGMRVDRFLVARFPKLAFTHIQRVVRKGELRVNGKRAKPNDRLEAGQSVRVPPLKLDAPRPTIRSPAKDQDDAAFLKDITLYEDADVLVLNKPMGLAVQGGSGMKRHVDGLLEALRDDDGQKPRLVHRLDKDTAGCLVVAKTRFAASTMAKSFRSRLTRKIYWALVAGVETAAQKLAWLSMKPVTGRTHQLRAHAAHIGHPIVGDPKYFDIENWELPGGIQNKLHLLARRIVIAHPRTGKPIDVTAPLPPHMQQSFNLLGLDTSRYDPIVEAPEE